MNKIKEIWEKLPKSVKVFFYLVLSTFLAEWLIEVRAMEQGFFVRFLAQVINLAIVFLEDAVPAVKARFNK